MTRSGERGQEEKREEALSFSKRQKYCRNLWQTRDAVRALLGEMFSIDSTLIRLTVVFITVTLVVMNGAVAGILPLIIAYIVGWIIVPVAPPEEDKEARMKKINRSQKDKKIAGICGGIGEMFSIDSTLIRLGAVFIG